MPDKFTAHDLVERIKHKYKSSEGHVVLEQVSNGTGFSRAKSWIDAAVFSTWPSSGLVRSAFEIKVDRQDFLAELQHPKKNQWAKEAFHYFWFVAPSNVIKEEELPENCGWMKPRSDKGLTIVRHASKRANPSLDDLLLSAFIRSAVKDLSSMKQAAVRDALDNSRDFKEAKYYQQGARKYIKERGGRDFGLSAEDVYATLVKCTLDKAAQKDQAQILHVLGNFQDIMMDMMSMFAMFAHHGMIVKDELGSYVTKTYGGIDKNSLDSLRKNRKKKDHNRKNSEKLLQMYELIEDIISDLPTK